MRPLIVRAVLVWMALGVIGICPTIRLDAQRITASKDNPRDTRTRTPPRITMETDHMPLRAVLQTIAQQAGLIPIFEPSLLPSDARVTLHLRGVPAENAFHEALLGTGLVARIQPEGYVAIIQGMATAKVAGTIVGTIVDARTRQPISNATVGLDGVDRTETAADGRYRFSGVSDGSHTLTVRRIGYTKAARTVVVRDNATVTTDVAMEPAASPLDQVVVTGTVASTELRAVPNAMTIITAQEIAQRGITRIDQLFRGDVPGLFVQNNGSNAAGSTGGGNPFDQVLMFSRGGTAISSVNPTNPIKTYLDGVELADPSYLSQLDPTSIERIEILPGPQASTIYGSNAINGVMQVFTKRGTRSTPQLTATLLSGFVENNFSPALTPQHDDALQLTGADGRMSYTAGGSWVYLGAWTPSKRTARVGGFAGLRLQTGSVSIDASGRRSQTDNRSRGLFAQGFVTVRADGTLTPLPTNGVDAPTDATLQGQTSGITVQYTPVSWWSHTLVLGRDGSDTDILAIAPGYAFPSDTLLSINQTRNSKTSLTVTSTVQRTVGSAIVITATAGGDGWNSRFMSLSGTPTALTGTLTGLQTIQRQVSHNRGMFGQFQIGIADALFLTSGLRAEWSPNYGENAEPNLAPRYGLAYTREVGLVTIKLRGSYGRATRPPTSGLKAAQAATSSQVATYGPYIAQRANPELGPESQQGGEGGMELYWGTHGSLLVTRYNQTVDDLILSVRVDSVRSLVPSTSNGEYSYAGITQQINAGSIRNQGWETQSTVSAGPITVKGTYSWTKSRLIGVTPAFISKVSEATRARLQPGYQFGFLPEHTWAIMGTYAKATSTISLNVMGTGPLLRTSDRLAYMVPFGRLVGEKPRMNIPSTHRSLGPGYVTTDLNAAHRVTPRFQVSLQVQNLFDIYQNDFGVNGAVLGRQTKLGAQVRL